MAKLFGTDGIRGQANCYPITPEVALSLGKGIAREFGARGHGTKRALIGKDTRLSGYMLESALTSGMVSMGMDVFLVGPIPTPAVAHLTRSMNADVGIMLTASHNPYDDNGIKIFDNGGFKLSDAIETQIESLILSGKLASDHIRSDTLGKAYRIEDARGRYIEFAKHTTDSQSLDGIKVVLDCANGAAYQIGPWIFRELGAQVIKAFVEPDGYNINNGCGALHPETVGRLVRENRADVGIALDGDADRVIFTDDRGAVVDGDRIITMCALDYKARGRLARNMVAVTSMSNMGLHDAMRTGGIRVTVTDVGDRQVIERMRADGLNLGGEKSGHVIYMDYATTGDGIITALQVLKLMKQTGKTIRQLGACMEEYPHALKNVPVAEKRPLAELKKVSRAIAECNRTLAGRGRVLVRYSGTERILRVLVEARTTAQVQRWTNRIAAAAATELGVRKA
jgi:phosphoglucosamine mutase